MISNSCIVQECSLGARVLVRFAALALQLSVGLLLTLVSSLSGAQVSSTLLSVALTASSDPLRVKELGQNSLTLTHRVTFERSIAVDVLLPSSARWSKQAIHFVTPSNSASHGCATSRLAPGVAGPEVKDSCNECSVTGSTAGCEPAPPSRSAPYIARVLGVSRIVSV